MTSINYNMPRASLLVPDMPARYNAPGDAVFCLRAMALFSVSCLATAALLSLATGSADIRPDTMAPRSLFAAILVGWLVAYRVFSRSIQTHLNATESAANALHLLPPTPAPAADQWRLCVLPAAHADPAQTQIVLLTPDSDYVAWKKLNSASQM
ncbi:hypothetical protein GGI04_001007 [Coemansia thaxteri]|uniref:Uncharacterized protein n=1 Tax=Coemansia thaxteri TaxID=2663907 RepID=A0A9W8BLR8_9FUNG|nr:hypothetical protein H4R26_001519 [Coemansia thaxteri]KAJ2008775.1 hypothetical protein GGI04_001007 [Coemansia thaxteri]KAJ2472904.1 hypothetical protein GGI02_001259 [Coemansia sp. RSA 2322]KAJ2486627.1 hypothetical protein EV174_001000 [Coemansia sp. RSA 2320]